MSDCRPSHSLVPILQVTRAFDGEEAYQILLDRGGPDAFDVILMDLHMPRKVRGQLHPQTCRETASVRPCKTFSWYLCTICMSAAMTHIRMSAVWADRGSFRWCRDALDLLTTLLHVAQGGMEVVRDVRQNWPRAAVRIIAVTADAFEDTREKCLTSGFDGWLAKPFRIEELASVMDAIPAQQ